MSPSTVTQLMNTNLLIALGFREDKSGVYRKSLVINDEDVVMYVDPNPGDVEESPFAQWECGFGEEGGELVEDVSGVIDQMEEAINNA